MRYLWTAAVITLVVGCGGDALSGSGRGTPTAGGAGDAGDTSDPIGNGGAGGVVTHVVQPNDGGAVATMSGAGAGAGAGGDVTSAQGGGGGSDDSELPAVSAGAGAGAGAGGESGAGGEGGATEPSGPPDVNECSVEGNQIVCDGLCGNQHECAKCANFVGGTQGYVVLGAKGNAGNDERACGCGNEATLRLYVKAATCSKFTVQPGAHTTFREESCSATPVSQCLVANGVEGGAGVTRAVYVSRPDQNAWVHQENAELVFNKCPLSCD